MNSPILSEKFDRSENQNIIIIQWDEVEDAVDYDVELTIDGEVKTSLLAVDKVNKRAALNDFNLISDRLVMVRVAAIAAEDSEFNRSPWSEKEVLVRNGLYGDGSSENPFFIASSEDFSLILPNGGTYVVVKNIAVTTPVDLFNGTLIGKLEQIEENMPTITLNIEEENQSSVALFREMTEGVIKNIITDGTVSSIGSECNYAAALVGVHNAGSSGVVIENCINYATISKSGKQGAIAYSGVGGFSGRNALGFIIKSSKNYGSISSDENGFAGGIAGYSGGEVTECVNYGSVEGSASIGGILGANYGSISKSANYGSIKVKNNNAGGIAGTLAGTSTEIVESYNMGTVSGGNRIGGIIGRIYANSGRKASIINCFNAGMLSADATEPAIGGIAGYLERGELILSLAYDAGQNNTIDIIGQKNSNGSGFSEPTHTYHLSEISSSFKGIPATKNELSKLLEKNLSFSSEIWFEGKDSEGYPYPQLGNAPPLVLD